MSAFNSYISAPTLFTPVATGVIENFEQIRNGHFGVKKIEDPKLYHEPLFVSKFNEYLLSENRKKFQTNSRFDTILLSGINELHKNTKLDLSSKDVQIFLATTKGNIELLEKENKNSKELSLSYSAKLVQSYLSNPNEAIIISNACISGISASIIAQRYLLNKRCKHAVVIGCDALSTFIISGFHSFKALDSNACKPFDLNRNGVNLGEAFAGFILSSEPISPIVFNGGFISNDANHISGPSKSGEELHFCIQQILHQQALAASEIDFIVAHGTATQYNDEMEAKAISLSGLNDAPIFSLKLAFGHTLGAAGLLEMIIGMACLQNNIILPSFGFDTMGVSSSVHINADLKHTSTSRFLKTGSGFGGCNAACIVSKI